MKKLMARTRRLLIAAAALFAAYSLAGFFLVPYLVETVVADKLSGALKRQVSIQDARFNPYSFNLRVDGFKVMEPDGKAVFASFEALKVNLQGRSLVKGGLTVKQLVLEKPYLRVVHNRDLTYNFTDLIPKDGAQKKADAGGPLKFSFNNMSVKDGSVDFVDMPKDKTHTVRDMNVEIPFISSIPSEVEIFVKPSFSARFNGTVFAFDGETKPFADSFETSLDIRLNGLDIPEYLAYSPVPLGFRMPSGKLFANLAVSYVQFAGKPPELEAKGTVSFKSIELQGEDGQRILRLPGVDVAIASVDPFARAARLSSVVLAQPEVSVVRRKDGSMNVSALVPGKSVAEPVEKEEAGAGGPKAGQSPAFTVELDKLVVDKARLFFTDLTPRVPFRRAIAPVDVSVAGFTTAAGRTATLKLSYADGSGESVVVDGGVSVNPVSAELAVKADSLDMRPLQPYLDGVVNLIITRGRASATGTLSAAAGPGGARLSYRGGALLAGFSAAQRKGGELVGWGALELVGVEFDLEPRRLVVGSVVLKDLRSNVVVNADGAVNIVEALSAAGAGKGAQKERPVAAGKGQPAAYMRIDSVELKGARVDFSDRSIAPVFSSSISDINGRMKGLYLDGSRLAELAVSGKIDRYAPFEASGRINPKKEDLFLDVRLKLDNFDLSAATPYSGRYIGYVIDKGKIFLALSYHVDKRALKAENDILIDQITLGERVESPRATKLPVSFAISLLKDRRGQIKLDVPLSGSLDDPEFSVASIVIQVIFNLLEKAITSPFALLGSIFGGGEDLGFVEFDPGSAVVNADGAKKLAALSTALFERPGLKLDIQGFAARTDDREALSQERFTRALKAEKLKELSDAGKAASVDEVTVGKAEYERLLWLAYKGADFPKEKNFIGFIKKLPAPEMEALLRRHTTATDDDLRALGASRANAVKDGILALGKVEPARVFILWPKDLSPVKKEGVRDSRVDFVLR